MQRQRESGRNASNRGWHVLHNSRSIKPGKAVLIYIIQERVSESIHWCCLKNEEEIQLPTISLSRLLSISLQEQILIQHERLWFTDEINSNIHRFPMLSNIISHDRGKGYHDGIGSIEITRRNNCESDLLGHIHLENNLMWY